MSFGQVCVCECVRESVRLVESVCVCVSLKMCVCKGERDVWRLGANYFFEPDKKECRAVNFNVCSARTRGGRGSGRRRGKRGSERHQADEQFISIDKQAAA